MRTRILIWVRYISTPRSRIRDGKNADPGSGMEKKSGSGMYLPDHFSESLETVFRVKILKFFYADPDPGSGIFLTLDPGWKNSDPG